MYFEYPIDSKQLLRKKKRIKRELLENNTSFVDVNIAILGGSTTDEIADQLELFLLHYGIRPVIYQSEYNKYYEEVLFDNPALKNLADMMANHHRALIGAAIFRRRPLDCRVRVIVQLHGVHKRMELYLHQN